MRWSQKHQVQTPASKASNQPQLQLVQDPSIPSRNNNHDIRSPGLIVRSPAIETGTDDTANQVHASFADDPQLLDLLLTTNQGDFPDMLLEEPLQSPNNLSLVEGLDLDSGITSVEDFSNPDSFWDVLGHPFMEVILPDDTSPHQRGSVTELLSKPTHGTGKERSLSNGNLQLNNQLTLSRPPELFNLSSALPDYFFKEVITLYCTWDNNSNPMRIMLGNMWQTSGALFHTVQSMAAACLSEDFPHLASVARTEHSRALQYLKDPSTSSMCKEDRVLATLMLGHTSSWLDPHDLATEKFKETWTMINSWALATSSNSSNLSFLGEALDYWTMLLSFVTETDEAGDLSRQSYVGPAQLDCATVPHSWNGISREVVRMITDTGRLIFRVRKRLSNFKFVNEHDLTIFRDALQEARRLEQALLDYTPMDSSCIADPGDPRTTLAHFCLMDEAYRYTGLLQLYRVFPDLLIKRYRPWNKDEILLVQAPLKTPTRYEMNTWLTKLAMHILGIIREIPFESRTRCIQPFVLVAVSSELRYDPRESQQLLSSNEDEGIQWISYSSIEIARARKFIGSRLSAYTHILPLRKVQQIYQLVNCIWAALDSADKDVFWVDIACQDQFSTVIG